MCGQELRESCNSTSSVWGRGREGFCRRNIPSSRCSPWIFAHITQPWTASVFRPRIPSAPLEWSLSGYGCVCAGEEASYYYSSHSRLVNSCGTTTTSTPLGSKEYRMSAHRTPYLVMDHKDTAVENVPRHPLSNIQLHSNWNSDQIGTFHPSLICLFCGLWGLRVFGPFSVRWSARRRRKKSASSTFFVRCFLRGKTFHSV